MSLLDVMRSMTRCCSLCFPFWVPNTFITTSTCIKCPRLKRTNKVYAELAVLTAMTEIKAGHLNCSGREKIIVDT